MCKNKGADQLHSYRAAEMRLVFAYAKSKFSHDIAQVEEKNTKLKLCMFAT